MRSSRVAAAFQLALVAAVPVGAQAPTSAPAPAAAPPAVHGPAVGERVPPFHALDQHGRDRDFSSLRGPDGLVLVFFRSADW